jgi:hypothetical protein
MKISKFPLKIVMNGFFICLLAAVIFSCSSKSDLASHIPKDANFVAAFDMKSVGLKSMDFKEILTVDNIKKAFASLGNQDTTSNDLKNTGIDFLNKAYFFVQATDNSQYNGAIVAALSDAKKFEDFIKKNENAVVTDEGNYKVASMPEQKGIIVAWNTNELIALFGDSVQKETILAIANQKEGESLASNSDSFKELEDKHTDVALWASFESFEKLIPPGTMPASNMNLKETFLTASCNFEDGQIVVDTKYYTNKEMAEKFAFIKQNVSNEVADALPGKSVIGMFGFALDMDKVYGYLEQEKLVEMYDPTSSQMTGLTLKEFLTMLTGDIAVTLNGIEMTDVKAMDWTTGQEVTRKQPQPDYCAVLGIANKEKATQLLGHLEQSGMLTKVNNYYTFQNKVFVVEKGSSIIITGTESMNQFALDGNGDKLDAKLVTMLTSNASSFYINPNNIPESVYAGNPIMASGMKDSQFEDLTITSSTVIDNVATGQMVIRFKEKGVNSLITLSRMSKKYGEAIQEAAVAAKLQEGQQTVSN